jgi:serpin B
MQSAPRAHRSSTFATVILLLIAGFPLPAAAGEAQNKALTSAYNASGQDLTRTFAAAPGNIVLSPYSIGTAMAMALSGTRVDTATEMAAALKHTLKREDIEIANGDVLAILNGYDKSKATLKVANALMLTKVGAVVVAPSYVRLLKDKYGAEIFRNVGLDEINAWVSSRTEGKVAKIFDRLDPTTALVLVNAVYFKGKWNTTFTKSATVDRDFNLSPSDKVKVPTMHQRGDFALTAGPDYRAIRLRYSVEALSMVIVLPNAIDGAAALAQRLDAAEVANLLTRLRIKILIDLAMPRFKAEFKASLVEAFKQMGMKRPFDSDQADFSGISGRPKDEVSLNIDQIEHRAVIEVGEEGTEAAAATGVSLMRKSAPLAELFNVDRPFLFYITDDTTGAILFQGRIVDPRQS